MLGISESEYVAALAFDHDIAGIGRGRRDQRDPAAAVMDDLGANTLRTAASLAKAATGQQQPGPPIASSTVASRASSWRTSRRRSAAPMCSPTTSWRSTARLHPEDRGRDAGALVFECRFAGAAANSVEQKVSDL